MAKRRRERHTLQLWPGGRSVEYYGDSCDGEYNTEGGHKARHPGRRGLRYAQHGKGYAEYPTKFARGTPAEWRAIRIEERARRYQEVEIHGCDSALVGDLLQLGGTDRSDLARAFDQDQIENLYQDPSDWTLEQCRDYFRDLSSDDAPDPNPWRMDRAELVEALTGADIECRDDESEETLCAAVVANIDDETISGIEDWREACRQLAQDNPAEVFEWWRVSSWLVARLREIGEVVIDNDYGCWWGRCTTGQQFIMDGVLQRIARGQDQDQTEYGKAGDE